VAAPSCQNLAPCSRATAEARRKQAAASGGSAEWSNTRSPRTRCNSEPEGQYGAGSIALLTKSNNSLN
jgi:hypothetical protein